MITISYRLCLKSRLHSTSSRLLFNAVRSGCNGDSSTNLGRSSFSYHRLLHNNKLLSDNSTSATTTSTTLVDSNNILSSLPLCPPHLQPPSKATKTTTTNLINKLRHNKLFSKSKFCKNFQYLLHPSFQQYKRHHCLQTNHLNVVLSNHTTSCKLSFYSPNNQFSDKKVERMAQIISGKEVADEIRARLKAKVAGMVVKPKLAIVQVGGREDSNVYIKMKIQFAESIGASAELVKLSKEVSENELAEKVNELNSDPNIHGIITQLPFDSTTKIDSDKIVNLIDPKKDVDGLCVYNAGKLLHGELNSSSFIACTPNGCLELIKKSGIELKGTRSVVIGRSKIVGSPMAQLLLWNDSTVTICHSRTKNLSEICRQADIIVAAVGRAQMVKKDWLKPGAIVIDCGINVIPDATRKSGTRLVGDVDFDDCKEVAGAITPVPGGVGPMTVAMLIANTVEAANRANPTS